MKDEICNVIFLVLWIPIMLNAWCPVGHYAIARECGVTHDEAGLYNLPDAWESYEWVYIEGVQIRLYAITDNFCWSHSVARTGRASVLGLEIGIPLIPAYHLEREPGDILRSFLTNGKVSNWGNGGTSSGILASNTAMYMSGHNAADRPVHWAYFGGGSIDGWNLNHRIKEEWADYAILLWKQKITFNANGDIDTFWGNAVVPGMQPMPFNVNMVNCHALRLAQLAARKKRFFLEETDFSTPSGDPNTFEAVDSLGDIQDKVSELAENVNDTVREMTQRRWLELKSEAINRGWMTVQTSMNGNEICNFSLLSTKFSSSVSSFVAIINP